MELCNRGFSNITQIASHDSAFMGILPMDNQNMEVSAQLDYGVRFLQAQTHLDGLGRFSLCHTDCDMKDSGSIQDFLATIINCLDTHPIEVVTLLLTNGDYVSLDYFEKAFNSSSASHHAYIPIPRHNASIFSSWPHSAPSSQSPTSSTNSPTSGKPSSTPQIQASHNAPSVGRESSKHTRPLLTSA